MAATALDVFIEGIREPGTPFLSPARLVGALRIEAQELATIAGVHRNTLRVSPHASRLQQSMRDIVRVVSAVTTEFGKTPDDAMFWIHSRPIAELGHLTAIELIRQGKTDAILKYLASIESGYVG
jgi:hypothetical protein